MSMKKLSLLIFALGMFFVSCEKDPDAIISSLKIENEKLTPSYTSISVECQLNTQVAITSVFVQYSTNKDFVDYQEVQMEKKDGKYIANVDELQDNTTYYIRYSVLNRYSSMMTKEVNSVKTLVPSTPDIQIVSVMDVLDKSANVLLNLKFDGGAFVTELGVCYGTSNNPSVENGKTIEAKENQTTISLTSLQENTTYYVRAYAKNKVGIAYSESVTFTTLTMPKVQTNDISNIQLTSATLNATLLSNGNDSTVTKGFCWSENSNPTITSLHIEVQNTTASFNYQLSNLKDETKYYVRAYAKNKLGVVYGAEKTFTTLSATKPIVSTTTVSSITYTSAKTGGNVTLDGGATVTDRGICYSTSSNPTISNSKMSSGSGTGSFSTNLAGLSDGTTYYIRAYATNKKGTSYGEQRSFTTNAYGKPTVTTSSATNISYTSASVGGNVTFDGGATVTERGVCYATYSSPTTSNSRVKSGGGTGSFTANLTSLSDGTTYYVRAYAINSEGTTYGSQVTFTTLKSPFENGHEYVDLGLSVKWATMNVGANSPEDHGEEYAWGELTTKLTYTWENYKFGNANEYSLIKYNYSFGYGIVDNKITLESEDDVASVNWGGTWRMPTYEELYELVKKCTWESKTQNGVKGYKVIGRNGNSIFIPIETIVNQYSVTYWSSSIYKPNVSYPQYAQCLSFWRGYADVSYQLRCNGNSIRAVLP